MSDPLSIAVSGWLATAALKSSAGTSTAYSRLARDMDARVALMLLAGENSELLAGNLAGAMDEIMNIAENCGTNNWDGYDAMPVSNAAINNTIAFVQALLEVLPMPEFSAEPDGSICLDWAVDRYAVFSISIGHNNRISYAWINGTDKGHGVARFDGSTIPVMIKSGVMSIMENAHNGIKVA